MQCLDQKTERYLAREANDVGYIYRDYSEKPTEELFAQKGIPIFHCEREQISDEKFVTIYNFPAHHGDFSSSIGDVDEGDEDQFHYASDWPVKKDNGGYAHLTYIFSSMPNKSDLETARLINKIWRRIECEGLNQHFTCRMCSQRTHWTDTKQTPENEQASLRERALMLQNEVCTHNVLLRELHKRTDQNEEATTNTSTDESFVDAPGAD